MIQMCLHTTPPSYMTMKEMAHLQEASALLLRVALMEIRITTTLMTGDHALRNLPTCMTRVRVNSMPQKGCLCDSQAVQDTDHAFGGLFVCLFFWAHLKCPEQDLKFAQVKRML